MTIVTRLLKQDGAKMSKIPLRNIKIVFFNLLVDVGKVSYADKAVPRWYSHRTLDS
jgi:hypothetical protein